MGAWEGQEMGREDYLGPHGLQTLAFTLKAVGSQLKAWSRGVMGMTLALECPHWSLHVLSGQEGNEADDRELHPQCLKKRVSDGMCTAAAGDATPRHRLGCLLAVPLNLLLQQFFHLS